MLDKIMNLVSLKAAKERRARLELARSLDKRPLKCVAERTNGIEEIIGRDGTILVRDGKYTVICGQDTVFRADINAVNAGELLSLEGVVLEGTDEISGARRSLVAYYKYWRKID